MTQVFVTHRGTDGEPHPGTLDDCQEKDCVERRLRVLEHLNKRYRPRVS